MEGGKQQGISNIFTVLLLSACADDGYFRYRAFSLNPLINDLFDGINIKQAVDKHSFILTPSESSGGALIFQRRIPFEVIVELHDWQL